MRAQTLAPTTPPGLPQDTIQHPQVHQAQPTNSVGILGVSGLSFSQEDLDAFFAEFMPDAPNGTTPFYNSVSGGAPIVSQADADGEATLDGQIAYGIAWPQQVTYWSLGGSPTSKNTLYGIWPTAVDGSYCKKYPNATVTDDCGTFVPTNTVSSSYAFSEGEFTLEFTKV